MFSFSFSDFHALFLSVVSPTRPIQVQVHTETQTIRRLSTTDHRQRPSKHHQTHDRILQNPNPQHSRSSRIFTGANLNTRPAPSRNAARTDLGRYLLRDVNLDCVHAARLTGNGRHGAERDACTSHLEPTYWSAVRGRLLLYVCTHPHHPYNRAAAADARPASPRAANAPARPLPGWP